MKADLTALIIGLLSCLIAAVVVVFTIVKVTVTIINWLFPIILIAVALVALITALKGNKQ
ncbi:MAG: hypothetical protein LBR20_08860 [Propionibacteriaceae bacterium]|jgi:hypothetical protein|nr:hypothetical protein [Propionibacteriaceae bacterium]